MRKPDVNGTGSKLPPPEVAPGVAADGLALAVALLWMLHPLVTQAISYTVQRQESLTGLLYLLTLYGLVRQEQATGTKGQWGWGVAAVLTCAVGMASKQIMVTAPVAALLLDRCLLGGSFAAALKRRWALHLGLATTWAILPLVGNTPASAVAAIMGPSKEAQAYFFTSAYGYILTQPAVILRYLRLSLWPHPLVLDYGWPQSATLGQASLPGAAVVALLGLVLWALWRKPAVGFLGAWFFLTLATNMLVPLPDVIVEHRMYLPLIGLVTLAVLGGQAALAGLAHRSPRWKTRQRPIAAALVGLVALALGSATVRRNMDYRPNQYGQAEAIWAAAVRAEPGNPRAYTNLGITQSKSLDAAKAKGDTIAIQRYSQAIVQNHLDGLRRAVVPEEKDKLHGNLGAFLNENGRAAEAVGHLEEAIRFNPNDPKYPYNLGLARTKLGQLSEAEAAYRRALEVNPRYVQALSNLGSLLVRQGRPEEAAGYFQRALEIEPNHLEANYGLSRSLAVRGDFAGAIRQFRRTLWLAPDKWHLYFELAQTHLFRSEGAQAVAVLEEGLQRLPKAVELAQQLAWVLATCEDNTVRNGPRALMLAELVNQATGDRQAQALDTLAAAQAEVGRFDQAMATGQRALAAAQTERRADLVAGIQVRLMMYQWDRPCRQKYDLSAPGPGGGPPR